MDDDEKICTLTSTMLQSLDYKFDIARNGEEAIKFYQRYLNIGRPYDAVIMDITVVGGMGGEECFHALKALDLSENKLTELPPSLGLLRDTLKLSVSRNPLQRPPAATARQGIGAIRKFFQEIVMTSQLAFHGARLVLLGHREAGKTSLQRALRLGPAPAWFAESDPPQTH